jgi:hypothetical protein
MDSWQEEGGGGGGNKKCHKRHCWDNGKIFNFELMVDVTCINII